MGAHLAPVKGRRDEMKRAYVCGAMELNASLGGFLNFISPLIYTYAPWGVHRTCRRANEIELVPVRGLLGGSWG